MGAIRGPLTESGPLRTVAEHIALYGDFDAKTLLDIARDEIAEADEQCRTTNIGLLRDRYARLVGLLAAIVEQQEVDR